MWFRSQIRLPGSIGMRALRRLPVWRSLGARMAGPTSSQRSQNLWTDVCGLHWNHGNSVALRLCGGCRMRTRRPVLAVMLLAVTLAIAACSSSAVLVLGPVVRVQAVQLTFTGLHAVSVKVGGTVRVVMLAYDQDNRFELNDRRIPGPVAMRASATISGGTVSALDAWRDLHRRDARSLWTDVRGLHWDHCNSVSSHAMFVISTKRGHMPCLGSAVRRWRHSSSSA